MKKGFKSISFIIILVLVMSNTIYTGNASSTTDYNSNVKITIPSFDVTLNGTKVDNKYSKYPLIVYNDITYFPMTYSDSRYLGIESKWSKQSGLDITSTNVFGEYKPNISTVKNKTSYTARVENMKITLNEKLIRNSDEKYPLLNFRNITYFPLTWKFAVDEFNWNYNFDEKGLSISSKKPIPNKIEIIKKVEDSRVVYFDNFIYYEGVIEDRKAVYRRNMDTNIDEFIFKLPSPNDNAYQVVGFPIFHLRNEGVYFEFHVGGATMGHDEIYKVNDDGKVKFINDGYFSFLNYKDEKYIILSFGPLIDSNNLEMFENEDKYNIGSESIFYNSMKIKNDNLYVTGASSRRDIDNESKLYKINLVDKKETLLSDINVKSFELSDNYFYIQENNSQLLYRKEINSDKLVKVSETPVISYATSKSRVFYIDKTSREVYTSDSEGNISEILKGFKATDIGSYGKFVICRSTEDSNYGILVLNDNGEIVFISNQLANSVSVYDDMMIYITDEKNCFLVKLESN